MWVPPEVTDPVCRHAPTRKSNSYFGAVRLRDSKLCTSHPEGSFDARTCWDYLRKQRNVASRSGRRVVVIIDNAKYHHANLHREWRLAQEPGFLLFFLPPYSPELNPVERVSKLLRRLWLHNRFFGWLAELTTIVDAQFTVWNQPNPVLTRLCAI